MADSVREYALSVVPFIVGAPRVVAVCQGRHGGLPLRIFYETIKLINKCIIGWTASPLTRIDS
jgi:hypothetical protein